MLNFAKYKEVADMLCHGQEAIFLYEQAYQSSKSNENKASSRKNQGYAATRIAAGITEGELESMKLYYIYQAIAYYKEAYKYGNEQDSRWKDGVHNNAYALWKMIN